MAILTTLDFLPFTNRRFCQMFAMHENQMYTDEGWRNGDNSQSGVAKLISEPDYNNGQASNRISTFDSLTQTLQMFDSDDIRNW